MTQQRKGGGKRPYTPRTQSAQTPQWMHPPMTPQEAIALGEMAANALENPVFKYAQHMTAQRLQDEWAVTAPEEKNKRDGLYWTVRGMSEYMATLNAMVNHAQEALRAESSQQPG